MLCKYAVAAEFNSFIHQFENYVLALLADRRDVFHLDNQFTATKICSGLFAGASQLGYPGCEELSFNHQPTLPGAINERDFQHCFFLLAIEARRTPSLPSRKLLNFQESNARTRNIEVEEVETVKTVEASRER
jgi:hypothetical protein